MTSAMIPKFVERWNDRYGSMRAKITSHPDSYDVLVKWVIETLVDESDDEPLDPERITVINHGDYQGTLLYVIGAEGYQPSDYWAVSVGYGSCSGCDTLEAIRSYDDEPPTESDIDQYMSLGLHIVQGLRRIAGYGLGDV